MLLLNFMFSFYCEVLSLAKNHEGKIFYFDIPSKPPFEKGRLCRLSSEKTFDLSR